MEILQDVLKTIPFDIEANENNSSDSLSSSIKSASGLGKQTFKKKWLDSSSDESDESDEDDSASEGKKKVKEGRARGNEKIIYGSSIANSITEEDKKNIQSKIVDKINILTRSKIMKDLLTANGYASIDDKNIYAEDSDENGSIKNIVNIPTRLRTMDEMCMRPAEYPFERECAKGEKCEGNFIDRLHGFTLVEYPSEDIIKYYQEVNKIEKKHGDSIKTKKMLKEKLATPSRRLCVLCERVANDEAFVDSQANKDNNIIPTYKVMIGEGEYSVREVLLTPENEKNGPTYAIINHNRSKYFVQILKDNKKRYVQKYLKPSSCP